MISHLRETALTLVVIFASGCASNELRETDHARGTKMQQAYLAHMLLPPSWDAARQRQALKRIEIEKWHVETFMGGTLGHVRFSIDSNELARIIDAQAREQTYFSRDSNASWVEHAFGATSGTSFDRLGEKVQLAWWPGACGGETQYFTWNWKHVNAPFEKVLLQVCRGQSSSDMVSLLFTSD